MNQMALKPAWSGILGALLLAGCWMPPSSLKPHQPARDWLVESNGPPAAYQPDPRFPIVTTRETAVRVEFSVANMTDESLLFSGYGPDWILVKVQHKIRESWEWEEEGMIVCATGLESFVLRPGESASISVKRCLDAWTRAAIELAGEWTDHSYLIISPEVAPWEPHWLLKQQP